MDVRPCKGNPKQGPLLRDGTPGAGERCAGPGTAMLLGCCPAKQPLCEAFVSQQTPNPKPRGQRQGVCPPEHTAGDGVRPSEDTLGCGLVPAVRAAPAWGFPALGYRAVLSNLSSYMFFAHIFIVLCFANAVTCKKQSGYTT